jgi:hypothetical protein
MLETRRSRIRFTIKSLKFSIDILLTALRARGVIELLTEMSTRELFAGSRARSPRMPDSLVAM